MLKCTITIITTDMTIVFLFIDLCIFFYPHTLFNRDQVSQYQVMGERGEIRGTIRIGLEGGRGKIAEISSVEWIHCAH